MAVVQDPEDALFPGMPESALRYADVDYCLPLDGIAPLLARVVREEADERGGPVPNDVDLESRIAGLDPTAIDSGKSPGELSGYTCPECSGPLFEIEDGRLVRYRCRVGHAYTAEAVLDGKFATLEEALYTALYTLEESAALADGLAARSRATGQEHAARRFEERARNARRQAETIRRTITGGEAGDEAGDGAGGEAVVEERTG